MKIRNDFVTNSSSSSFIIVGKKVDLCDVDLSKGEYLFLGKYLAEGRDVLEIDKNILDFLNNNYHTFSDQDDISIIKCFITRNTEYDDRSFTVDDFKKCEEPFEIIDIEKDYHGSEAIEDLKDRYLEGGEY